MRSETSRNILSTGLWLISFLKAVFPSNVNSTACTCSYFWVFSWDSITALVHRWCTERRAKHGVGLLTWTLDAMVCFARHTWYSHHARTSLRTRAWRMMGLGGEDDATCQLCHWDRLCIIVATAACPWWCVMWRCHQGFTKSTEII